MQIPKALYKWLDLTGWEPTTEPFWRTVTEDKLTEHKIHFLREFHEIAHLIVCNDDQAHLPDYGLKSFSIDGSLVSREVSIVELEVILVEAMLRIRS